MKVKRERYTPSDIGPTPEDWDAPYLKEISTLITNGFVGTATPYYKDSHGVKYLYGNNVRENRITLDEVRYITTNFHEAQSKTKLHTGDLLTVQSGHIGTTAVVPPELNDSNCHALIVTRLVKEKANPYFLSYYMNSHIGRARMRGLEVGSTILHINTKDLKKFRVPLPSLSEQDEIANILSTWDKAIEAVENLIENSRQHKKALMQQLLTGEKRLPSFANEWHKSEFGHIASLSKKKYDPKKEDASYACIELEHISQGTGLCLGTIDAKRQLSTKTMFKKGDILFGKLRPYLRKYWLSNIEGVCSTEIWALRANNKTCLPDYLFHLVQTEKFIQACNVSSGSRMPRADWSYVSEIPFELPDITEQKEIAAILNKMDTTLNNLYVQHEFLISQKNALMQQLLTGKRRVKTNA